MDLDIINPLRILGGRMFVGIGNMMGWLVKTLKITKIIKYTSYVRICVYMNVLGAFLESIIVSF